MDHRSPGEIPDQLDISWRRPVSDSNTTLFEEVDGGSTIDFYVIEWDTDPHFHFGSAMGKYEVRNIDQQGVPLPCTLANCTFPLGSEVQILQVYSGDGNTLVEGEYMLRHTLTHYSNTGNNKTNASQISACIPYDAPATGRNDGDSSTNLESAISGVVDSEVRVSREAITTPGIGFEYRITFIGAGVRGDIAPLEVITGEDIDMYNDSSITRACKAFKVQDGSANRSTVLAQVSMNLY